MARTETIAINRGELETALAKWDKDAKEGNWPDHNDPDKAKINADYLLDSLVQLKGADAG